MFKAILISLGSFALMGPIAFALQASTHTITQSFWEFYPLLVSGVLLSLVVLFFSFKINTKIQSSS